MSERLEHVEAAVGQIKRDLASVQRTVAAIDPNARDRGRSFAEDLSSVKLDLSAASKRVAQLQEDVDELRRTLHKFVGDFNMRTGVPSQTMTSEPTADVPPIREAGNDEAHSADEADANAADTNEATTGATGEADRPSVVE